MKVFGIGLSKSGTTSLADALEILGVRTKSFPTSPDQIDQYDAVVDTPIAASFEQLDQKYPGSRYIYTIRPLKPWLKSCESMWRRRSEFFSGIESISALHRTLYGSMEFDEIVFTQAYFSHRERVDVFFKNRPNDLLIIDITNDPAPWDAICGFLNKEAPSCPFPHSNASFQVIALIHHIAKTLQDMTAVLAVTGVPENILFELKQGDTKQFGQITQLGTDWETRLMLNNAVKYFGGITKASQILHLCENDVNIALRNC